LYALLEIGQGPKSNLGNRYGINFRQRIFKQMRRLSSDVRAPCLTKIFSVYFIESQKIIKGLT
jgi:hypothetical protein